ncbi:sensor histidine kinase [Actinomadura parmotrematis]|uniref:histidine kinase n=1 Tax=Actinomadura parmotrematis TaxID=2864039 RepID=A0ABS7G563_9ACTN|nr:histidine kinase [Actinomadura parmotrematis]MBW8487365.1 sensor histidine kinase [Actinomadura parmotrematis]
MGLLERSRPFAGDGALAAVMAVLLAVFVALAPGAGPLDFAGVLTGALALAVLRRAPLVALAVSTACMLAVAAHVRLGPPVAFPVLVSVFVAVHAGYRVAPAVAGAVFLGAGLLVDLPGTGAFGGRLQSVSLLVGWFVAAAVAATVARHRRAYLEEAERRAAEAERTREEAALRRAGEERLRIARELHDSLTHSISVIKVQAGVAVHLARRRGEEVPPALLAIQEAGGDAMRELRATLEVLRDAGDPDGAAPASGLDRLDDLVRRAGSAGLPTTLEVRGTRRELPAEVDRAAYRIVQEALTNASRHAGGAAAAVRVAYADAELVVQVDDDGKADPAAPPVPGTGLLGMRERVAALGGRLRAEPRAGGGFTVRAELPLGGTR